MAQTGERSIDWMKQIILCMIFTFYAISALAYPVKIQSWDLTEDVKRINSLNLSIDRVNIKTGSIIVYVQGEQQHNLLLANGFDAIRIPDQARDYYEYLVKSTKDSDDPMNEYFSLDEYHAFLQSKVAQYPNLCELHQYGTSVQSRPLYVLKISDNVNQNEAEPEIKLIASIHGDETVGYDMMIRLIDLLTSDYGSDPRITNIVNNSELWISPLMNPDGYVNGQRFNAAGVDLNRNFPMPNGVNNPDGNPHAPENIGMMDFSNEHNFVLGINFHGGSLVINYPWDYSYELAPDNDLIIDMALTYSVHNLPMYNSEEFDQGITNGAQWYVITGSMQDWNYAFTSNIELTAEISNIKWPPASTLDSYWADNQESIVSFIEYAQRGVTGTVRNSYGEVIPARIEVLGNSKITRNDPIVGDYRRLLLPGTYDIRYSSPHYLAQTAQITVPAAGQVVFEAVLENADIMNLYGTVRNRDGFALPDVNIQLLGDEEYNVTTAADGSFYIAGIYESDYLVKLSREGYGTIQQHIELRQHRLQNHCVLVIDDPLFYDDFESGLAAWVVSSPWAIEQDGGNSILSDSPNGDYGNNINRSISLEEPVSLVGRVDCGLNFKAKWDLESGYDYVYLEGSANGNNWTQLASFTGNQPEWTEQFIALDDYAGGDLYLRFRIRSDWSQTADGIYIDDVTISGRDLNTPLWGDVSQDGLIDGGDVTALLQYTVGDELSGEQLVNADVDLIDGVKTIDAQQILHFMRHADFRFSAQSSEPYTLPELELTTELIGDTLHIEFAPELRSLHLEIPYAIDAIYLYLQDEQAYIGIDKPNGLFSLVHDIPIAGSSLAFKLVDPEDSFEISAEINGYEAQIQVGEVSNSQAESPALPLTLSQNYPNPFNPETSIAFFLPEAQTVCLQIFNIKGQLIKTLVDNAMAAGEHNFVFDGTDQNGRALSNGVYLYRLQTPDHSITRKMVLNK